jgi:hypothetical protein
MTKNSNHGLRPRLSGSILGAAIAIIASSGQASADPWAYEATANNAFGLVDLSTGAFSQISSLAFQPAGFAEVGSSLYTSSYNGGNFYQIDPATGVPTLIGASAVTYAGLGSTSSGAIYALDSALNLYSVSSAGVSSLIGSTGVTPATGNSEFTISVGSSTLYLTVDDNLYTLNTSSGAAASVGSISGLSGGTSGSDGFGALAWVSGQLYGGYTGNTVTSTNSDLYRLNSGTGAGTFVASFSPSAGQVYGLAPAPEPGTWALTLVGLAGLGGALRARARQLATL